MTSFSLHLGTVRRRRDWDSRFTEVGTEARARCDLLGLPGEEKAVLDGNPGLLSSPAGLFVQILTATVDEFTWCLAA